MTMTREMATIQTKDQALRAIELRIAEHFENAARNLLQVGACLNEAKERKLVPHGQWEAWVKRNTGMDVRKAQRLMQAAREVPDGSAMMALDFSKISMILALPEGEREAVAVKAVEDDLTTKQLRREIERLQEKGRMVDEMSAAKVKAEHEVVRLRGELDKLIRSANQVVDEELAKRVEEATAKLRQELAEAEEYAAQQAELRQQAQQELLDRQVGGRDEGVSRFGANEVSAAVRTLIGECGVLPQMGAELARMPEAERTQIRRQLAVVRDWLEGSIKALDTLVID